MCCNLSNGGNVPSENCILAGHSDNRRYVMSKIVSLHWFHFECWLIISRSFSMLKLNEFGTFVESNVKLAIDNP